MIENVMDDLANIERSRTMSLEQQLNAYDNQKAYDYDDYVEEQEDNEDAYDGYLEQCADDERAENYE